MEITVNRLDIKNAVERIIAAVPRKMGLPILSHIKVVATPEEYYYSMPPTSRSTPTSNSGPR